MMQLARSMLCMGIVALLTGSAGAAILYGPDTFDAGRDGWETWAGLSSKGFALTDVGGGDQALAGSGRQVTVKKTPALPLQTTIELDFAAAFPAAPATDAYFAVHFHAEQFQTSGSVNTKSYIVRWVRGYDDNTRTYGLQLLERTARWGTATILAENKTIPFDNLPHSLRITDDGTGKFNVYFDNALALSYDDSDSYSATAATNWLVIETGTQMTGGNAWFQNVTVYDTVVPEPATLALLALGGIVAAVRRRAA